MRKTLSLVFILISRSSELAAASIEQPFTNEVKSSDAAFGVTAFENQLIMGDVVASPDGRLLDRTRLSPPRLVAQNIKNCREDFVCSLYRRLARVNPDPDELKNLQKMYEEKGELDVAKWIAENVKEFKSVTLRNWASTWADKDGNLGSPFNDTILTLILAVTEEIDFRKVLYDDLLAVGNGDPTGKNLDKLELKNGAVIEKYFYASNQHYLDLELEERFTDPANVKLTSQQQAGAFKDSRAISGILSTNGVGRAAYTAGTNRRVIPMILREATCLSLEELRDSNGIETYISRDVDRFDSDGTTVAFKTNCKTCHSFQDQLYGAFVYYDISKGRFPTVIFNWIEHVPATNKMNKNVLYAEGYVRRNSAWTSEFTDSQLSLLGWPSQYREGFGAKSLGMAFANSSAFARCQPKKAFKAVCHRAVTAEDEEFIDELSQEFVKEVSGKSFILKDMFLKAAIYCSKG